jgi:hypothetical protein
MAGPDSAALLFVETWLLVPPAVGRMAGPGSAVVLFVETWSLVPPATPDWVWV